MKQSNQTNNGAERESNKPSGWRFRSGQVVATPGALAALEAEGIGGETLVQRHMSGDWGEMCTLDSRMNDHAVRSGGVRILSSYRLPKTGARIWIITEADWSVTTLLLPDEY